MFCRKISTFLHLFFLFRNGNSEFTKEVRQILPPMEILPPIEENIVEEEAELRRQMVKNRLISLRRKLDQVIESF